MASKERATSNEEIIAALLCHGTIKEAARSLDVSPRSVYDRMGDADFKDEYKAARTGIVRRAVSTLNGKLSQAIDTIGEIMADKNTNPAIRLQAAQTILTNAAKFSERLALEDKQTETDREAGFIIFP